MSFNTWLALFLASWLISLSPGPGAVASMSTGLRCGYVRGVWNIFGLQLGVLLLVAVVGAGMGAVLGASLLAFEVVRWAGVAYLVFLGFQQWRSCATLTAAPSCTAQVSRRELFLRGFLINASNPKGIIFMLAVLPQFIEPAAPLWPQYAICALTLVITDMVVMSAYTMLAPHVVRVVCGPRQPIFANRLLGGLFLGAGLMLAAFKRS